MNYAKYKSISQSTIHDEFMNYVNSLEISIIDYIAFGVQDLIEKKSTSIMSQSEWQNTFKTKFFPENDPVRIAAFNAKSNLFTFDEISCQNSVGAEIMRQRKLHNINNGFVLVEKHMGFNFMLTMATGYKKFAGRNFFFDNHQEITKIMRDLKRLIAPVTKNYQYQPRKQAVDNE